MQLLEIARALITRREDTDENATTGACEFTAEEIATAPPVTTEPPGEDD